MQQPFKAEKITDSVYWVGVIDWGIRDFHGYATSRGTTYNAYLILADKITLIDTVKAPFRDEMLSRIASVVNPEKISYIVSNHSEMDHTGCLLETIEIVKPEKIFASKMGVKALQCHFHHDREIIAVEDDGVLSLGNIELNFMETRMLHWPDSMFTYVPSEGIVFSQDAFGMHLASSQRFDDDLDWSVLRWEEAKYYANILLPYSDLVRKLLEKIAKRKLKFKMILPDHGPVIRKNVERIIGLYDKWSKQAREKKAVIAFDTMWGSTAVMARVIADGIAEKGIDVRVMPLSASHRSDVATEMLDAGALLIGSPMFNRNIFPTVADVLVYLKGLAPKNLIGAAFGSYGWGGGLLKQLDRLLEEMNVELVSDGLSLKYVPDNAALIECREFGVAIAEKLIEKCAVQN